MSSSPRVIAHNLDKGLPFPDEAFDAVYHSHVLEHFQAEAGERFIRECFRVLKPGGVLRVVVPDLEQICRVYLEALEKVEAGDRNWRGKYDWIKLELYDQAVRTKTGGAMAEYLRACDANDQEFVINRAGNIARQLIETGDEDRVESQSAPLWQRALARLRQAPSRLSRRVRTMLLSKREKDALRLGLFRMGGEIHQWMYDVYSLRTLLAAAGFCDVRRTSATESSIPDWNDYHLDVDADGFEHAPASLYFEGVKRGRVSSASLK